MTSVKIFGLNGMNLGIKYVDIYLGKPTYRDKKIYDFKTFLGIICRGLGYKR